MLIVVRCVVGFERRRGSLAVESQCACSCPALSVSRILINLYSPLSDSGLQLAE